MGSRGRPVDNITALAAQVLHTLSVIRTNKLTHCEPLDKSLQGPDLVALREKKEERGDLDTEA